MKVKVDVHIDGDLIYTFSENADLSWVRHEQPSIFRRINLKAIDSLSKILEKIGLSIVKHNEPDVDHFMYLAWFHPVTNDSLLRGVDIEGLRREYNEKKDSAGTCQSKG